MKTFPLRVLAPERTFFDGACTSLTVPSIDGIYGLMAQHEDIVLAIVPGKLTLRDADGVTVRTVEEHCEILSLMGTVSEERCHLHIALSRQGLGAFGGHLKEGCLINTTCELVIGVLDGWRCGMEQDGETGYDEITFERTTPDV